MEFADENDVSAPPPSKDPIPDGPVELRSPLKDLSNQPLHDSSSGGVKDKPSLDLTAEKLTVSSCEEQSESPACSTPRSSANLDTTTDDYESADEGTPEKLNLTEVATQLEKLHVTTPKKQDDKPFVFPYSPLEDSSFEETANQSGLSENTLISSPTSVVEGTSISSPTSVAENITKVTPEPSRPHDAGGVSSQVPPGDNIDKAVNVPVVACPGVDAVGRRNSASFVIDFQKSTAFVHETAVASEIVDDCIAQAQDSVSVSVPSSSPGDSDSGRSDVSFTTGDDLSRTVVEVELGSKSTPQKELKKGGFSDSWEVVESSDSTQSEGFVLLEQEGNADKLQGQIVVDGKPSSDALPKVLGGSRAQAEGAALVQDPNESGDVSLPPTPTNAGITKAEITLSPAIKTQIPTEPVGQILIGNESSTEELPGLQGVVGLEESTNQKQHPNSEAQAEGAVLVQDRNDSTEVADSADKGDVSLSSPPTSAGITQTEITRGPAIKTQTSAETVEQIPNGNESRTEEVPGLQGVVDLEKKIDQNQQPNSKAQAEGDSLFQDHNDSAQVVESANKGDVSLSTIPINAGITQAEITPGPANKIQTPAEPFEQVLNGSELSTEELPGLQGVVGLEENIYQQQHPNSEAQAECAALVQDQSEFAKLVDSANEGDESLSSPTNAGITLTEINLGPAIKTQTSAEPEEQILNGNESSTEELPGLKGVVGLEENIDQQQQPNREAQAECAALVQDHSEFAKLVHSANKGDESLSSAPTSAGITLTEINLGPAIKIQTSTEPEEQILNGNESSTDEFPGLQGVVGLEENIDQQQQPNSKAQAEGATLVQGHNDSDKVVDSVNEDVSLSSTPTSGGIMQTKIALGPVIKTQTSAEPVEKILNGNESSTEELPGLQGVVGLEESTNQKQQTSDPVTERELARALEDCCIATNRNHMPMESPKKVLDSGETSINKLADSSTGLIHQNNVCPTPGIIRVLESKLEASDDENSEKSTMDVGHVITDWLQTEDGGKTRAEELLESQIECSLEGKEEPDALKDQETTEGVVKFVEEPSSLPAISVDAEAVPSAIELVDVERISSTLQENVDSDKPGTPGLIESQGVAGIMEEPEESKEQPFCQVSGKPAQEINRGEMKEVAGPIQDLTPSDLPKALALDPPSQSMNPIVPVRDEKTDNEPISSSLCSTIGEKIEDGVGGAIQVQEKVSQEVKADASDEEKKVESCSSVFEVAEISQAELVQAEENQLASTLTSSEETQEQLNGGIAEVKEKLMPDVVSSPLLPNVEAQLEIEVVPPELSKNTKAEDSEFGKVMSDENRLKSIRSSANTIAEMLDNANSADGDLLDRNPNQLLSRYTRLADEITIECDTPFSRPTSPRPPATQPKEVVFEQFSISPKKPLRQLRFSWGRPSLPMNTSFVIDSVVPESNEMSRSYKDLSQIMATCSKQGQELGGSAFDFNSCIEEDAKKIAAELSQNNDSSNQRMMQSSLTADINSSEAGPITADEDFKKEDYFQDASTVDFDYLSQVGGKRLGISNLTRQSLFVKFDPLVEKLLASSEEVEEQESQMADNQSSSEEGKPETPSRYDGDERLIALTPATGKKEKDVRQTTGGHTPSLRAEISKLQELMIQQEQAHQEKADLVEELRSRIAELEATESSEKHGDAADLQKQLSGKTDELNRVKKELSEQVASNKQLVQVMEEYEKTISQLVAIKEESKAKFESEKEAIATERDQALQHLSNMELAFNDIHQKYERAKGVIETFHANEVELKKSYDSIVDTVEKQKQAYQKFKAHAAETLQKANAEVDKVRRELTGEVARHKALLKKSELKCKSLEESLDQKQKELREMTEICDELITNMKA